MSEGQVFPVPAEWAERAHIGAALNVTPDHLDRHYTMERYAEAKGRLFVNQRPGDFAVLNADDQFTRAYAERGAGSALWFSSTHRVEAGAWLDRERIMLDGEALMGAAEVPLRGVHNLENAMAAANIAFCTLWVARPSSVAGIKCVQSSGMCPPRSYSVIIWPLTPASRAQARPPARMCSRTNV